MGLLTIATPLKQITMTETMLHIRENQQDTEAHKDGIAEKLQSDINLALRELYKGRELTATQMAKEFYVADWGRRLRNIFESRKDVKRDWVYTPDGKKTRFKKFWMEISKPETKSSLQAIFGGQKLNQKELF